MFRGISREMVDLQFKEVPQSEDCESPSEKTEFPMRRSSSFKSQLCTIILLFTALIIGAGLGAWLGGTHFIKANDFCFHEVSQDCRSASGSAIGELTIHSTSA